MTERAFVADAREAKGLHDGSVTCLVRVVDPQPTIQKRGDGHGDWYEVEDGDTRADELAGVEKHTGIWRWFGRCWDGRHRAMSDIIHTPFGVVGDRLWLGEEWYYDVLGVALDVQPPDYDPLSMYYRAEGECCQQIPECCCGEVGPTPWASPEQMPPRLGSGRNGLQRRASRYRRVVEQTPCRQPGQAVTC